MSLRRRPPPPPAKKWRAGDYVQSHPSVPDSITGVVLDDDYYDGRVRIFNVARGGLFDVEPTWLTEWVPRVHIARTTGVDAVLLDGIHAADVFPSGWMAVGPFSVVIPPPAHYMKTATVSMTEPEEPFPDEPTPIEQGGPFTVEERYLQEMSTDLRDLIEVLVEEGVPVTRDQEDLLDTVMRARDKNPMQFLVEYRVSKRARELDPPED